ncbi:hypothetical protein AKJ16_DCAP17648 [Drosera capensis]
MQSMDQCAFKFKSLNYIYKSDADLTGSLNWISKISSSGTWLLDDFARDIVRLNIVKHLIGDLL